MQLGLAVVRGASMQPTYVDGDVLLVAHGVRVRLGKAHLMRLPDGPDGPRPLAVKRLTRQDGVGADGRPTWWAERDNPRVGVDSWLVGAIPDDDVRARVLGRVPPGMTRAVRLCRTYVSGFRRPGGDR